MEKSHEELNELRADWNQSMIDCVKLLEKSKELDLSIDEKIDLIREKIIEVIYKGVYLMINIVPNEEELEDLFFGKHTGVINKLLQVDEKLHKDLKDAFKLAIKSSKLNTKI